MIGFIGLEECLVALTGKKHSDSKEAQKLGLQIVGFMKNKVEEFSIKHNLNFALAGIDDEELAEEFMALDKAIYGKIKGITDKNAYTSSFYTTQTNLEKKIKKEAPYHELTNGGHLFKIEREGEKDPKKFEELLKMMKDNNIGYASIN